MSDVQRQIKRKRSEIKIVERREISAERGGLRDSQVSGRCSSSGALISYRKHREERERESTRERSIALPAEGGGETMAESRPRGMAGNKRRRRRRWRWYRGWEDEGEKRRAAARNAARGDCVRTSGAERDR